MPLIPSDMKQHYVLAYAYESLSTILDRIAAQKDRAPNVDHTKWLIIIATGPGEFRACRVQAIATWNDAPESPVFAKRLNDLLDHFIELPAVEPRIGIGTAERNAKRQLLEALIVVQNGEPIGVIDTSSAVRGPGIPDPFVLYDTYKERWHRGEAPPPADLEHAMSATREPSSVDESVESPDKALPERFIKYGIPEHPRDQPLEQGRVYPFVISISPRNDARESDESITLAPFLDHLLFTSSDTEIEIAVKVVSRDFRIFDRERRILVLPKSGPSRNRAHFDIEPLKSGIGELTILFYKDNNFIQGLVLRLRVEEPGTAFAGYDVIGRPLDDSLNIEPRDLNLYIRHFGDDYDFVMVGATAGEATLRLSRDSLGKLIEKARQALQQIVYLGSGPAGVRHGQPGGLLPPSTTYVFQTGIDIPEAAAAEALRILAGAGWDLYQDIFFGSGEHQDLQLMQMGRRLRELARRETLKIQIVSEDFTMPWGILYLAERFDETNIDPELFLGLKHIIEHIPLQQQMLVLDPIISSQPQLSVSLNLNTDIDTAFSVDLVGQQINYWRQIEDRGVRMHVQQTCADVRQTLSDPSADDQIIYFYCHGSSPGSAQDDSSGWKLSFVGAQHLALSDLKRSAPVDVLLAGKPLIFVNACESATLSPIFYEGFAPYFTSRGARGMIGTECVVPVRFADAWARRFFDAFLRGEQTVGEIFLTLRRAFFYEHNNVLGLLYALYCDGDTRIRPGLALS